MCGVLLFFLFARKVFIAIDTTVQTLYICKGVCMKGCYVPIRTTSEPNRSSG